MLAFEINIDWTEYTGYYLPKVEIIWLWLIILFVMINIINND